MIKSMTGFGKGEAQSKLGRFIVEIRTVNHRFFDVSSRMPNSLSQLEDRVKNLLHKSIKRGRVNICLSHKKGHKNPNSIKLDHEVVAKYYRMLRKIRTKFKLKDDIELKHLLSFPDVIVQEQQEYNLSLVWPFIERAVKIAVLDCNRMREKEGRALYRDLTNRISKVSDCINEISKMQPKLVLEYKHNLDKKIRDILKHKEYKFDTPRIETELAIFAKQCDVSEEIIRAESHLIALKNTLKSNTEAGRRLDFILQELQREINTLGSKAGNVRISRFVVEIKSEIEKMREQVQNVE